MELEHSVENLRKMLQYQQVISAKVLSLALLPLLLLFLLHVLHTLQLCPPVQPPTSAGIIAITVIRVNIAELRAHGIRETN